VYELDVHGEYESGPQFYLWLRRDFPGDDDLVYINRWRRRCATSTTDDVAWELGLGRLLEPMIARRR